MMSNESTIIYGDGTILAPIRKENNFIYDQRTVNLREQKVIMDLLWGKYACNLTGAELKALLFIMSRTLGFNKLKEIIHINSFRDGILDDEGQIIQHGPGMSSATTHRALKGLLDKELIVKHKRHAKHNGNNLSSVLQLNINFLNIEILKNYYEFTIDEASELLKSGIIRKSRRLTTEELQQYGLKNNE